MQIKKLLQEDDAVSPVIGVILMVAITVILAAVIASFVLGLGGSQQQTPQASFSWDFTEYDQRTDPSPAYGVAEISHDGGDSIRASELYVRGDGLFDPSAAGSDFEDDSGATPATSIDSTERNWKDAGATATGEMGDSSAVVGGNTARIAAESNFEFSLVWEPQEGDTSATLSEETGPDA